MVSQRGKGRGWAKGLKNPFNRQLKSKEEKLAARRARYWANKEKENKYRNQWYHDNKWRRIPGTSRFYPKGWSFGKTHETQLAARLQLKTYKT